MFPKLGILLCILAAVNCKPQSCSGVSCLPNPGNCKASYVGGSCCPVYNCANQDGGTYSSYGLSRVGGGPGSSFSQSSISTSSGSGPGLSRIGGRSGYSSSSGANPNFAFAPLPRLLTPYEFFTLVRSAFPAGWFNGAV